MTAPPTLSAAHVPSVVHVAKTAMNGAELIAKPRLAVRWMVIGILSRNTGNSMNIPAAVLTDALGICRRSIKGGVVVGQAVVMRRRCDRGFTLLLCCGIKSSS